MLNDVLQSRNGREWAQNNKIGKLGLTFGPGATPDPKLPRQAMRADEEDGASSGCLARNDRTTSPLARRYAWGLETIEGRPLRSIHHHHLLISVESNEPEDYRAARASSQ
ncbi:hypothetical protein E3N88_31781 [Mikania micrantha]|uniref:Uncharacterized protein n=1 Tax=Mikania micrantha TaxID=192012 RepID=A0A5N6M6Y7_9ASTR|nr:hypothetical protein E3N88_31781 [Mikania micrantha]